MSEKKLTKKEQRLASDARIIASAIKNFGEKGFTNCTLAHIAKDAGVTSGLVIQRFESKEKLFLDAYLTSMDGRFGDVDAYRDFPESAYRLINDFKKFKQDDPVAFQFFKTVLNSMDLTDKIRLARQEVFESRQTYKSIVAAQQEGQIIDYDAYSLFQAFLMQVVNQIDISDRFGLVYPEDDYFLRVFKLTE